MNIATQFQLSRLIFMENLYSSASTASPRIVGVDLARSFVVFLVICAHSLNAFNNNSSALLQLLFRTATPTFIVIFGIFLEIAYARNMAKNGTAYVSRKLFSRAIQCYALYVISCLVLAASEGYGIKYTLRMAALMGATPYTDILKFYTVMLLIAPLLLIIKRQYGLKPLILFCLLVHMAHYLFSPFPYYHGFPGCEIVFGFLYGATTVIGGPSILHGITFVVTGMWLGQIIRADIKRYRLFDAQKPHVIYLWLACVVMVLLSKRNVGGSYIAELASMKLRNSNSYIYFLFGIAGAISIIDISMRIAESLGDKTKQVLFLGINSLPIFCFSNSLLYLTKRNGLDSNQALLAVIASVFITILGAIFINYLRIKAANQSSPAIRVYAYVSKGYADDIAKLLIK